MYESSETQFISAAGNLIDHKFSVAFDFYLLSIFCVCYRKEESNFKKRDSDLVFTEQMMVSLFA